MKRRELVPLVIVLMAGVAMGCSPLTPLEDMGIIDGGSARQAEAEAAAAKADPLAQVSTTLAGDDFTEDVVLARSLTEKYWQQQFEADGRTYRPIDRFIPYTGSNGPACGDQPAAPDNAFYCPIGHFVAFDQAWLKDLYDKIGDGAVYVIIPHELGHAVQDQLTANFRLNKERELQADCYAGGVIGWLVQAGRLQAEKGDEEELLDNLQAAGDPTDAWWRPDAHGTGPQRQEAFRTGYEQGVVAC